jgi:hypothetical protein
MIIMERLDDATQAVVDPRFRQATTLPTRHRYPFWLRGLLLLFWALL